MIVRRRIRPEREMVPFRGSAQMVEDQPRLDRRAVALGFEPDDTVHVFAEIEEDRDIAALAGEARAAAASEHGRLMPAAHGKRLHHLVRCPRDDHADRDLAVVRARCRVQRAAPGVEPHFPPDRRTQIGFERAARLVRPVEGAESRGTVGRGSVMR